MSEHIQYFIVRLLLLALFAPLIGLYLIKVIDLAVVAWKTNDRKKKWVVTTTLVAILAGLMG